VDDATPIRKGGAQPIEIADLREIPLSQLAADPDGVVGVLVNGVLECADDPQRVRVATFNSVI
jgi:FXSXX-COOH protein